MRLSSPALSAKPGSELSEIASAAPARMCGASCERGPCRGAGVAGEPPDLCPPWRLRLRHQGTRGRPAQSLAWTHLGPAWGPGLAASVTRQVCACLSEPPPGAAWEKLRAPCMADPMRAD